MVFSPVDSNPKAAFPKIGPKIAELAQSLVAQDPVSAVASGSDTSTVLSFKQLKASEQGRAMLEKLAKVVYGQTVPVGNIQNETELKQAVAIFQTMYLLSDRPDKIALGRNNATGDAKYRDGNLGSKTWAAVEEVANQPSLKMLTGIRANISEGNLIISDKADSPEELAKTIYERFKKSDPTVSLADIQALVSKMFSSSNIIQAVTRPYGKEYKVDFAKLVDSIELTDKDIVPISRSVNSSSGIQGFKKTALDNKDIYLEVSNRVKQKCGVNIPWELIAAIHNREGGMDFSTYLHNGQKLGAPTTIVPKNVNFPNSREGFLDAAVDALTSESYLKHLQDKDNPGLNDLMLFSESFNGFGYRSKGIVSPYIWAGTEKQQAGKYVADGVFDPDAWDKQLGIAKMYLALKDHSN